MTENNHKLGCLLIHGFTSHRSSLEAVIPELEKRNIPWHYPILAGHGTQPEDLADKTWAHWQRDVATGLSYLLQEVEQVITIAISMGALLAMELAIKNPEKITGLILLSPCLHFYTKIAKLTPIVSRILKKFPNPSVAKFSSLEQARRDQGYLWFPTSAFRHYWLQTQNFDQVLKQVYQPTLIIQSKNDKVAVPSGAEHIFKSIPATDKKIIWLEKSGHESLLDCETNTVIQHIFKFLPSA